MIINISKYEVIDIAFTTVLNLKSSEAKLQKLTPVYMAESLKKQLNDLVIASLCRL